MSQVIHWFNQQKYSHKGTQKLLVTLSYAQALDGSLTDSRGRPVQLSGPEALRLTHQLRAHHDAILAGIGTVLSDDPLLTVRKVRGRNPQPIILDSRLRIPLDCKLLQRKDCQVWVACSEAADESRQEELRGLGVELIPVPLHAAGGLDLKILLRVLASRGVESIMVEGGAKVVTSFLVGKLADLAVITLTPYWMGGLNAYTPQGAPDHFPVLARGGYEVFGENAVVYGELEWRVK